MAKRILRLNREQDMARHSTPARHGKSMGIKDYIYQQAFYGTSNTTNPYWSPTVSSGASLWKEAELNPRAWLEGQLYQVSKRAW
jgi:hypothetical protein